MSAVNGFSFYTFWMYSVRFCSDQGEDWKEVQQVAPEGWAPWYRAVLEQCSKCCSLWEAHAGSVREGWHPTEWMASDGRESRGEEKDHGAVAEAKRYGLNRAPIPYCPALIRGRR